MCYLLFTDTLYKLVPQIPASTAMERERPAAFSAVFKAPPRCHFFRDSFLQTCHLESITFPSPSSDPGPTTTATATSVITPHPPLPKRQFKCSRGKRGKQTYPLGAHGKGAPLPSRISGSSGEGPGWRVHLWSHGCPRRAGGQSHSQYVTRPPENKYPLSLSR